MSLNRNSTERAPLWNKAMARYLAAGPAPLDRDGEPEPAPPESSAFGVDEKVFARLGLKTPPSDPRLLAEFLVADDAADAANQADEFARGIRRAVRLNLAFAAGLHRRARQPWKTWVEGHFKIGYACFHRYHVAAELQIGLITRGLPLLTTEHQSRSIAPFRRHEKFWAALAAFKTHLPPAAELKSRLRSSLDLDSLAAKVPPRIKLHRVLQRVAAAVPTAEDDPAVVAALTLLGRAIAILEKGAV